MPKEFLNPPALSQPSGYSHVVKAGSTVYIAGQVALNSKGEIVGAGDAKAQARQVLANLEAAVKAAGGAKKDIVSITTYLVSRDHLPAYREARSEFFGDHPPASTLLIISGLARPEILIEVSAVAALG
ncbi:MAG: RidA family protein [Chloroflexi bacterium]|nr:RidA family protein [Chloroflexota bacterium]